MKPLEIGETATLENGDVVKCEILHEPHCHGCYFKDKAMECSETPCLRYERPDYENVYYVLVEKIPQSVEEIRKE